MKQSEEILSLQYIKNYIIGCKWNESYVQSLSKVIKTLEALPELIETLEEANKYHDIECPCTDCEKCKVDELIRKVKGE